MVKQVVEGMLAHVDKKLVAKKDVQQIVDAVNVRCHATAVVVAVESATIHIMKIKKKSVTA